MLPGLFADPPNDFHARVVSVYVDPDLSSKVMIEVNFVPVIVQ
jgi:hypothetical protein